MRDTTGIMIDNCPGVSSTSRGLKHATEASSSVLTYTELTGCTGIYAFENLPLVMTYIE